MASVTQIQMPSVVLDGVPCLASTWFSRNLQVACTYLSVKSCGCHKVLDTCFETSRKKELPGHKKLARVVYLSFSEAAYGYDASSLY